MFPLLDKCRVTKQISYPGKSQPEGIQTIESLVNLPAQILPASRPSKRW